MALDHPRKRKSADARRAEIVETVLDIAAKIGPDRVTTQHVADAVGVTQPAIFRHFSTKADIWEAVAKKLQSDLEQADVPEGDGPDTLRDYLERFFDLVVHYPALPSILHSHEMHRDYEGLSARFAALHARRHARLSELLNTEHADRIDSDKTADLLHSALHGLTLNWTLKGGGFDLHEAGLALLDTIQGQIRP